MGPGSGRRAYRGPRGGPENSGRAPGALARPRTPRRADPRPDRGVPRPGPAGTGPPGDAPALHVLRRGRRHRAAVLVRRPGRAHGGDDGVPLRARGGVRHRAGRVRPAAAHAAGGDGAGEVRRRVLARARAGAGAAAGARTGAGRARAAGRGGVRGGGSWRRGLRRGAGQWRRRWLGLDWGCGAAERGCGAGSARGNGTPRQGGSHGGGRGAPAGRRWERVPMRVGRRMRRGCGRPGSRCGVPRLQAGERRRVRGRDRTSGSLRIRRGARAAMRGRPPTRAR